MKIKVDKLSYKEFAEYTDSTFAKPVKMSLAFCIGVAVILIIIAMNKPGFEGAITALWWWGGILAVVVMT